MLIPLITYPYLIRVLGKEKYGLVVFAQAIIGYLSILVSLGFNVSATKKVSVFRNDKNKLNEIFSSVLILKSYLFLISLVVLAILLIYIPMAHGYESLFLLSMTACINDVLYPSWYFQGIERMKYITYLTLVSRLTFMVLIFFLIKSPSDYIWVPAIYGIGYIVSGIISSYIVFVKHKIRFYFQPVKTLKIHLFDSFPIFVSNVSVVLYISTNKVITGALLGMEQLAYYDLAEKIIIVLKTPINILGTTLFPKFNHDKNLGFAKKILRLSWAGNVILFLLTLIFSKNIVLILGGPAMEHAFVIVNILAITIPVIAISNLLILSMLLPFNKERSVLFIVFSTALLYIISILLLILLDKFTLINISILLVIIELWATFISYIFCKKHQII